MENKILTQRRPSSEIIAKSFKIKKIITIGEDDEYKFNLNLFENIINTNNINFDDLNDILQYHNNSSNVLNNKIESILHKIIYIKNMKITLSLIRKNNIKKKDKWKWGKNKTINRKTNNIPSKNWNNKIYTITTLISNKKIHLGNFYYNSNSNSFDMIIDDRICNLKKMLSTLIFIISDITSIKIKSRYIYNIGRNKYRYGLWNKSTKLNIIKDNIDDINLLKQLLNHKETSKNNLNNLVNKIYNKENLQKNPLLIIIIILKFKYIGLFRSIIKAREKAAREKAAREKAAREKAARNKAAREKAERKQAAREKAYKNSNLLQQQPDFKDFYQLDWHNWHNNSFLKYLETERKEKEAKAEAKRKKKEAEVKRKKEAEEKAKAEEREKEEWGWGKKNIPLNNIIYADYNIKKSFKHHILRKDNRYLKIHYFGHSVDSENNIPEDVLGGTVINEYFKNFPILDSNYVKDCCWCNKNKIVYAFGIYRQNFKKYMCYFCFNCSNRANCIVRGSIICKRNQLTEQLREFLKNKEYCKILKLLKNDENEENYLKFYRKEVLNYYINKAKKEREEKAEAEAKRKKAEAKRKKEEAEKARKRRMSTTNSNFSHKKDVDVYLSEEKKIMTFTPYLDSYKERWGYAPGERYKRGWPWN